MELDERLRWIEIRVTSSLKPRAEELKRLFTSDDCRSAMFEFCNNEEVQQLYVFSSQHHTTTGGPTLEASLSPPKAIREKAMYFLKVMGSGKVTRDNIAEEVAFCDCSYKPLEHVNALAREVYLPLLSIEMGGSVSADKLMDLLHRLVAHIQVTEGSVKDQVVLPLPSIEVLSEAAAYSNRRPAVIHVLETAVVNWIKQIKITLKLEPDAEVARRFGAKPGPLDEIQMWSERLEKIHSINEQLCSNVALNILMNLEDAHSTYANSFNLVKREIAKAEAETNNNLQFLSTVLPWCERLHYATKPSEMVVVFAPLIHTLFLVWAYSRYYHDSRHFLRLVTMLSNEVVARARLLVHENVLDNLIESYSSLKDALRVCAAFRGCYLDKKDSADYLNQQKLVELAGTKVDSGGIVWHSKLYNESLTPRATKLFSNKDNLGGSVNSLQTTDMWTDSPWPARNNAVFASLNNFMERCNDVLELVQTTRHFELLTCAAEVGGAGGEGLDCLVKEIHVKFCQTVKSFQQMPQDVLDADESQQFERDFFVFRSVIRDLEVRLAHVLRQSFHQCWDTKARLRLLEVFEGISGRELLQSNLKDIFDSMVHSFTTELADIRIFFESHADNPPRHLQLPPVASKLLWLRGLKLCVQDPMSRLHRVSPASLKGEVGWRLRDTFSDLVKDIEKCEDETQREWRNSVQEELRSKLKQPLLIAEHQEEKRPPALHVNFDPDLLLLLREVNYLAAPPFCIHLTDAVRMLLRTTDVNLLRSTATHLETIVSRYNDIIRTIQDFEWSLFEIKIARINELLEHGLNGYTWKSLEAADFIEHASFLVCDDVHHNLGVVQTNFKEICIIADQWSKDSQQDVFTWTSHGASYSYSMEDLQKKHQELYESHKNTIISGGLRIHALLQSTFEAVQISRASPSWQNYIRYVSNKVLDGLKRSVLASLKAMLNQIVYSNIAQNPDVVPIVTIRLELVGSQVLFNPSLDVNSASHSVQEYVKGWLNDFLNRTSLVTPLDSDTKSYRDVIFEDEEIKALVQQISDVVDANAKECKSFFTTFREYAFLWMQDVQRTFEEFLAGNIVAHPRKMNRSEAIRSRASITSAKSKKDKEKGTRASSHTSIGASSLSTSGAMGLSERTFLNPQKMSSINEIQEEKIPSLDDFDKEIEIYKTAHDEIEALQDWSDVGWTRVNMRPIKQVLGTYASKWMFVYTKYLSDQVSSTLKDLDSFLKRIEPGIEAITGKEQDIKSFMRLMRVFNEVSTQQAEMDSKFLAMKRTIALLEKYGQKLPEMTERFYKAAPQRWNSLKMKVSQAKQRLGPRIQAGAESVTKELKAFGDRCDSLSQEFSMSEVFNRKCAVYNAMSIMDSFSKKMEALESEAQDLIELQELFEKPVVNFSVLPQLRSGLGCLHDVWNTYRVIQEQHTEWKRGRWQRINTKLMWKATEAQLNVVRSLPADTANWDVYVGMHDSILDIQACLPIIDDLSRSSMRPRHWKQLVRLTGGAVQISNDGLTRMTLGQLLELGLQNHADEVRAIIQRATKDVAIESSLKTYEEVWLSKIFDLRAHSRIKGPSSAAAATHETPGSEIDKGSEIDLHGHRGLLSSRVSVASHGSGGFSSKDNKTQGRRNSVASAAFSHCLLNLTQDSGPLCLLNNCDPIFEELEEHQVALQSMLSGSAASSFADDIMKWQKRLQIIEGVLSVWLEVQAKWVELEDVFSSLEVRIAMPHETNLFSAVNRDFRVLMKVTEKNPNVLQACSKTNIQTKLEKINMNLQQCWKSLLNHLERRRQKFPRFYFLSMEDVLHVVCNGYDPSLVNPYISKVLENVGALEHEEFEAEGQTLFQITAVLSRHGERLTLKQPVLCDGPIDGWLTSLINTMKQTLAEQLTVTLESPSSDKPSGAPKQNEAVSEPVPDKPPGTASSFGRIERSFTLDNVTEVVYLATQIEVCKKIAKALEDLGKGDKAALQRVHDKLTVVLESAALMLRGEGKDQLASRSRPESEAGNDTNEFSEEALWGPRKSGAASETTRDPTSEVDAGSENTASASVKGEKVAGIPLVGPGGEERDTRLLLFPSQIQKITNIIAMLSHKREVVRRLIKIVETQSESVKTYNELFDWRCHAQYSWDGENQSCKVNLLDMLFQYGFEYQGTCSRLVLTPLTERCLLGLAQAVKGNTMGMCVGSAGSGKTEMVKELARMTGYSLYSYNCSQSTDRLTLVDLFRGLASSGCWVCLNRLGSVQPQVLSILTQLLEAVLGGLRATKSTAVIQEEEVPLVAQGACFATLVNHKDRESSSYDPSVGFFPPCQCTLSQLPTELLEMFRPVPLLGPDLEILVQVWLLGQGFIHVASLSSRIVTLRDLSQTILPYCVGENRQQLGSFLHTSTGWGLQSIQRMIADAGFHLASSEEESISQTRGEKQVDRLNEADLANGPESEFEAVAAANVPVEVSPGTRPPENESESEVEAKKGDLQAEEKAVVLALRDTFIPGLRGSDAVLFATLLADLFPGVDLPTVFESLGVLDGKTPMNEPVSNLEEIPATFQRSQEISHTEHEELEDIQAAIAVATCKLGLQPGCTFQSRVFQLAQLVGTHKVVCVVGPSGSGKTKCIKTLAATHREMGRAVKVDVVCTEAMDSGELLGYADPETSEWRDGLLAVLLRRHAQVLRLQDMGQRLGCKPLMKWMHLDGKIADMEMEIFSSIIQNNGSFVLANKERIKVPDALLFLWEMESLENLSPQTLSSVGLLCLNSSDVSWPLLVERWLAGRPEREVEVLRKLCDRYIAPTLEFLACATTVPPASDALPTQSKPSALRHVVAVTEMSMIRTLLTIVESIIANYQDLIPSEFENYFSYAAMWAFGGTLVDEHRQYFSLWWADQWREYVTLPGNEEVWNYYVFPETHEFVSWRECIPPYAQTAAEGIPNESYVHTVENERISHLIGLLSEAGKPVLLMGAQGCGKTSIVKHRLNQHGGDIGEVSSLTVFCNKFTSSRTLWHRLSGCLEWKHANTFLPKGNKKLSCLIDDLNLSKVSESGSQSACELVRQHIDHGGVFDPESREWREIRDVTYLSSYNPYLPPTKASLSNRLLRHFALFNLPFPSAGELHYIYTQQLENHFVLSGTQSQSDVNDVSSQEGFSRHVPRGDRQDNNKVMRGLLGALVHITLELQENLRTMFLPIAQRCHYIFTMTNLTMVFRNICLTLRPGCSEKDLLLLWKHECHWVYERRLIDPVDKERYHQTFHTAAKKWLADEEQLSVVTGGTAFFTNLIDNEDKTSEVIGGASSEAQDDDVHLAYRQTADMHMVRVVLEHGIEEYNKDFPNIKINLYDNIVESICRLVRVLQCPHECGHALMVALGSPGLSNTLAQLAAHLCDYSVFRINPSSLVSPHVYSLDNFKADLVTAYTRAGVKGEHLLLLLPESDIVDEDFLVYVSEFLVSCSISHLFSEEEQTSVINAVRTEVTQAGLAYTRDVAWNFFLKTVRENLRIVLTVTSLGPVFQSFCRDLPSLINSVSIILLPHLSKDSLVDQAYYHLRGVEILDSVQKENLAHLLASMHLALRYQDLSGDDAGTHGHITNTSLEVFVERFISLFRKRREALHREHLEMSASLKTIERGSMLADKLKNQLQHEKMILEQKEEGNQKLLMQIGQDRAIAEEQIKLVRRQQDKIEKLKKALPEYQLAHERAVFKAAAVVSDTKRILKYMDSQGLAELRAMQKPDSEIEDLLAAIIIIVKSPTSDLTWNKGAKRLMANLDRFREELSIFDDAELPESTLEVVEPYLKKPHFSGDYLEQRMKNAAVGSLVLWVKGVVRYHRMMQSRVKPLHSKVADTSAAVDQAEGKLAALASKHKDLEERLQSLAHAYEEACIDKCRQFELAQTLQSQLQQAAHFEEVLSSGRQKWFEILRSINSREIAIAGGVAMAAAFATYLGPYSFVFRREMLTVHWPRCLDERGVPLVLDTAGGPNPGAQLFNRQQLQLRVSSGLEPNKGGLENEEKVGVDENANYDESDGRKEEQQSTGEAEKQDEIQKTGNTHSSPTGPEEPSEETQRVDLSMYDSFSLALMKLLVGDDRVRELLTKGMGPRKIENAVLARSSWGRVSLLTDPHNKSLDLIRMIEDGNMLEIDLGERHPSALVQIEKAVTTGAVLVLYNIEDRIDSLFMPLIYNVASTVTGTKPTDPQVVRFGSRRVMCHPDFKLYMISRSANPRFSTEVASITTLIDFSLGDAYLAEEIQLEAMARVRPKLYVEARKILLSMMEQLKVLENIDSKLMSHITAREGTDMWDETELIAELVKCRVEITRRLGKTLKNFDKLTEVRRQFRPLANHAVTLFSLLSSLATIQHEYRFHLDYFLSLFRQAVGEDLVLPQENLEYHAEQALPSKEGRSGLQPRTSVIVQVTDDEGHTSPAIGEANSEPSSTEGGSHSNRRKRATVILPPEAQLPSPGVEYTGITDQESEQLLHQLTKAFYKNVNRSLYGHHRLLFATLVFLKMKEKTDSKVLSDEELRLLLTGETSSSMGLTLSDFDPTLLQPSWISQSCWDSIMAASTLKGPLDSVCAHIAANPTEWRAWFEHDRPESVPLPLERSRSSQDQEELTRLNSFHRLLLIRCTRVDRLRQVMRTCVKERFGELFEGSSETFSQTLPSITQSVPVFVLQSAQSSMNSSCQSQPREVIRNLAKTQNTQCKLISFGQGQEGLIDVALATAIRTDSWLIIDKLHLASTHWMVQLYIRLARLHLQAESSQSRSHWRVFLLSEPSPHLPVALLLFSHQLAWDVVQEAHYDSLGTPSVTSLTDTIVSTLKSVPRTYWDKLRDNPLVVRTAVFGLCVIHSVLCVRQALGSRALTTYYAWGTSDLVRAVHAVQDILQRQGRTPGLAQLTDFVARDLYGGKLADPWDQKYISALSEQVFSATAQQQGGSVLTLGTADIPIPPANVDPADYAAWFQEKIGSEENKADLPGALSLHSSVQREYMEASSTEFIRELNVLYRGLEQAKQGQRCDGDLRQVDMVKLREAMDTCLDKLPTLLNIELRESDSIGDVVPRVLSQLRALSLYSETGSVTTSDERTSESVAYTLQKECEWFNCLLCHTRQTLHVLEQCVLGGASALPRPLAPVVDALQCGRVPEAWMHPNCRPSPHSLVSWLDFLRKTHHQMSRWIQQGLVPRPGVEPMSGKGHLESVWLGGLANPGALITSLRHEKAASCGCTVEEVELKWRVAQTLYPPDKGLSEDPEDGLVLTGLYLEGASFDSDKQCLEDPTNSLVKLPDLCVNGVVLNEQAQPGDNADQNVYNCPVFMNRARQFCPFVLPFKSSTVSDHWVMAGTALLLDPGEVNNSWKLIPQRD